MGPYSGERNFLSSFYEPVDADDRTNSKGPSTETQNLAEQCAETSTSEIGRQRISTKSEATQCGP